MPINTTIRISPNSWDEVRSDMLWQSMNASIFMARNKCHRSQICSSRQSAIRHPSRPASDRVVDTVARGIFLPVGGPGLHSSLVHIGEFVGQPRAFAVGAVKRGLQLDLFGLKFLSGNIFAAVDLDYGTA